MQQATIKRRIFSWKKVRSSGSTGKRLWIPDNRSGKDVFVHTKPLLVKGFKSSRKDRL